MLFTIEYNTILIAKYPRIVPPKIASRMYSEFASLINYYYRSNGLEPIYEENTDITEDKLAEI